MADVKPLREDMVESAVKFLKDPKVISSPLGKKIAFLESKGLSSEEIQEAISRTSSNTTSSNSTPSVKTTNSHSNHVATVSPPPLPPAPYPYQMYPPGVIVSPPLPHPPSPRQYDWRDYVLGVLAIGGGSYGAYRAFKVS